MASDYNKFEGIWNYYPKFEEDLEDALALIREKETKSREKETKSRGTYYASKVHRKLKRELSKTIIGWTKKELRIETLGLLELIIQKKIPDKVKDEYEKNRHENNLKERRILAAKPLLHFVIGNYKKEQDINKFENEWYLEKNKCALMSFIWLIYIRQNKEKSIDSDSGLARTSSEGDVVQMIMALAENRSKEAKFKLRDKLQKMIEDYRKETLKDLAGDPLFGILSNLDINLQHNPAKPLEGHEGVEYWNHVWTTESIRDRLLGSTINVNKYSSFLKILLIYRETEEILRKSSENYKLKNLEKMLPVDYIKEDGNNTILNFASAESENLQMQGGVVSAAFEKLQESGFKIFSNEEKRNFVKMLVQHNMGISILYAVSIIRHLQLTPLQNNVRVLLQDITVSSEEMLKEEIDNKWWTMHAPGEMNNKNKSINDRRLKVCEANKRSLEKEMEFIGEIVSDIELYNAFAHEYAENKKNKKGTAFLMPKPADKLVNRKPFDKSRTKRAKEHNDELLKKIGELAPQIDVCWKFLVVFSNALKARKQDIETMNDQHCELFMEALIPIYSKKLEVELKAVE